MSDEHSLTLHRAAAEYRDLGDKLRECARASISLDRGEASRGLRERSIAELPSVIGETPEWMLWALVGLLIFVMLTPALKR
jgi:hypothetical protein